MFFKLIIFQFSFLSKNNQTNPGAEHEPNFTVTTELGGEKFEASGLSKQKAKLNVAVKALRKLGFGNILGEEIKQEILSTPTKQQQQSVDKVGWTFEPFSPEKRKFKSFFVILFYNFRAMLSTQDNP